MGKGFFGVELRLLLGKAQAMDYIFKYLHFFSNLLGLFEMLGIPTSIGMSWGVGGLGFRG
jgi:hypothetical protein